MLNAIFPKPGDLFAERYRVNSVLNRGGFSQVFRADQIDLQRTVAIKVLRPVNLYEDSVDRDKRLHVVVERFKREARTVSQLRDAHTIEVFDYGSTPTGLMYMVMEYVAGNDLNEVIHAHGKLEPERVVRIADQVLCSLAEAHALDFVHRDIKPANIMLYDNVHEKDLVKLLDFGLVKSMESDPLFTGEDPGLTGDDNIVGTPRYMSPEQIRGSSLDARSDLYSLGLVLYEMLTGEKALEDDTAMKVIATALGDQNIILPDGVAPPSLTTTVNALLEKDPALRPASANAVRNLLTRWCDEVEVPVLVPVEEELPVTISKSPSIALLIAPIVSLLLIAILVISFRTPEITDSTATEIEPEAPFIFDEVSVEEAAIDDASQTVYTALPDPKMLEFALTAVGEMNDEQVAEEKSNKVDRPVKRRKKKKKPPKELKIRTLDNN